MQIALLQRHGKGNLEQVVIVFDSGPWKEKIWKEEDEMVS